MAYRIAGLLLPDAVPVCQGQLCLHPALFLPSREYLFPTIWSAFDLMRLVPPYLLPQLQPQHSHLPF